MEEMVLFNEERKAVTRDREKIVIQEELVPSYGFLTIEDELIDLKKRLSFVGGSVSPPLVVSSIILPSFLGDAESEETKKLLEKYSIQQAFLRKLFEEELFLKKVLEKFYESSED